MNTDKYNNKDGWHDAHFDALEFIEELEEEELINDKSVLPEDFPQKDKLSHRKHRQNLRKAKSHQIELANSVKRKRHSPYRWNPVWHKIRLSDVSAKKLKSRLDESFAQKEIKEFENS